MLHNRHTICKGVQVMSKILRQALNNFTDKSRGGNHKNYFDDFFIGHIFPSTATIYPLKNKVLILLDKDDRILSAVSHDSDFKKSDFSGKVFSFAKSDSEMDKIKINEDKSTLYLLKNIPTSLHSYGYSLLLITEDDVLE